MQNKDGRPWLWTQLDKATNSNTESVTLLVALMLHLLLMFYTEKAFMWAKSKKAQCEASVRVDGVISVL